MADPFVEATQPFLDGQKSHCEKERDDNGGQRKEPNDCAFLVVTHMWVERVVLNALTNRFPKAFGLIFLFATSRNGQSCALADNFGIVFYPGESSIGEADPPLFIFVRAHKAR